MTIENERQIIKREPPEKPSPGRVARIINSVLEKIPITPQYANALVRGWWREFEEDYQRCLQEVVLPDLQDKGLLGKHELIALPQVHRGIFGNLEGRLEGSMFLFIGRIKGETEGELKTCASIQFAWKPNEKTGIIITEIPIDEFVFETDNEIKAPIVEFDFDTGKLIKNVELRSYARTFPHPNDYLKQKYLRKVTLTLNSEAYKALPLPKGSPQV